MPAYATRDIRNIALLGHAGAGKTSLVEALLKQAGVVGDAGRIDRRDTVSDHTEEEKQHGRSLFNSIVHLDHHNRHINLIDTPGTPDFLGQSITALPAVETAAIVLNAAAGIEPVARRMMRWAGDQNLCRMIVINRIDAASADELAALVQTIQETFGNACLPINLPAQEGRSVVEVFDKSRGDSDFGSIESAHTAIVDQVVEVDEALMATYLEQGEVTPEQLHEPFEKALRDGHLVPICFTASSPRASDHGGENAPPPVGVDALLEMFVNLVPSPLEGNPRPFIRGEDREHELHARPDPDKHALAHVFSIRVDPFKGRLAMFRVHQGTVTADTQLYVDDPDRGESRKPFKVSHLFKLQGAEHVEVDAAIPGDIAAIAKVDHVRRDAVLHDSHEQDQLHLRPLTPPRPMHGVAVTARKRADEQKLADALHKLGEEDPGFEVTRDPTTHETVIHGMGEMHLRVILETLDQRYHVQVDTHPPTIAYRETVRTQSQGHCRHKKQTGGAGQFGEVYLRLEPLERSAGFEFVNDIFGGTVPQQFIPAVEKGVRQAMEHGALAGYPIQDVRVSIYDGKHHPVDSKEIAFVTAGKEAFLDAFAKARPVLLEPMVHVEVTASNEHMGDITGDLAARRGRIEGVDVLAGDQAVIRAIVPLAELNNYQSRLRSVTGGQGRYTMELSRYDPVPLHLQEQLVAQFRPAASDA